eukprot:Protomagalhaensia_wolfi_Nauph_80__418@NODE_122_length_3579_cov_51_978249_g94_i0_p6_GENE_NODE_122_length_3579_cov_51_978249_g94_i0NODE_122_length_3579_cov_51_978249_g94_i0_p6_ORF_typecomplete_len107_score24_80_NODE_122_length_3579_cov_51_978249_g94_i08681188
MTKKDKAKVRQNIWKAALRAEEERRERGEKQRAKKLVKLERQAVQRATTAQAADMVDAMVEGPSQPDQKVKKFRTKGEKKLERRIRKRQALPIRNAEKIKTAILSA